MKMGVTGKRKETTETVKIIIIKKKLFKKK